MFNRPIDSSIRSVVVTSLKAAKKKLKIIIKEISPKK